MPSTHQIALVEVLKRCGDNLTRENVMKVGFLSDRTGANDAFHWRAAAAVRPDIGWPRREGCTFIELD